MLKKIIYTLFMAGSGLLFTSCEKVIDVDIKEPPNQLVIEGNITDVSGTQTIKLSQSVPYTDTNIYPPVSGAVVTVSDDTGNTWTFTETEPGQYTFGPLQGVAGRKYTMTVTLDNKTYTATSIMPQAVPVDSLSITKISFGSTEIKTVAVHYTDPAGIANQYRYVMRINGVLTKRIYASNDRLQDGKPIKEQLFYGRDDDNKELESGDVVEVEMQGIDMPVFKYWFTLSQQTQRGPGGGVTPGNPPSNISGGVLGYFSAHTTQIESITVD
ncbi:DUF4249 domain-containing protein [Mucilaginibacter hurinus]|uniref:DUF4249 domain-containing protein n=1 Tax=Mucilaginibacter hurinus TaxID=2201324 RepID=A0A367GSH5_9SPHI|nr:DUF4249 domain-containing protein [Mucilaginibacter hurinus]RCH56392.1 DUF4249 domain-containing protein [Mucilaginibacter hurinus]